MPNANYLWIGYFATALNDNGKAALVMANSASDAGGSELEIRKKMIEDGIISQMVQYVLCGYASCYALVLQ